MLTACWSVKGGAGTTVVAAALGVLRARSSPAGAVAVDLAGDLPAVLGLSPLVAGPPGLAEWLAAVPDVLPDALARLEVPASDGLAVLLRGQGPLAATGGGLLASMLGADPRDVVVDCGRLEGLDGAQGRDGGEGGVVGVGSAVVAAADRSLLVLRPCYASLRRAVAVGSPASGIVLVLEEGRAITRRDVESSLGTPVVATVKVTEAVARAVDAGLFVARLPRSLARELSDVR